MDFVLIGTFGDLGFQICQQFLEEGYSIEHADIVDGWMEKVKDERRMWVERNSNFEPFSGFSSLPEKRCKIILPCSDWSSFPEEEQALLMEQVSKFLEKVVEANPKEMTVSFIAAQDDPFTKRVSDFFKNGDFAKQIITYPQSFHLEEKRMDKGFSENPDQIRRIFDIIVEMGEGNYELKDKEEKREVVSTLEKQENSEMRDKQGKPSE